MNKKIILTAFIAFLIISGFLSSFSNAQIVNEKKSDSDRVLPFFGYIPKENEKDIIYDSETIGGFYNLPSSWDWRDVEGYDFTTPIKSQGSCGSCWAFAAIAALESVIKLENQNTYSTPDLSEQYLVSCCKRGCYGCMGGCAYDALKWLDDKDKIPNEDEFEYTATDAPCKSGDWSNYQIGNPYATFDPSINDLKCTLMEKGPLVATMAASDNFYYNYDGGIYHYYRDANDNLRNEDLNHQVVIVGFKDTLLFYDGYWICKNSWGKDWGENGWFRVAYGYCLIDDSGIVSPEYSNPDAPKPELYVSTSNLHFQKSDTKKTFTIRNDGDVNSKLIWYVSYFPDSAMINDVVPSGGLLEKGESVTVTVKKDKLKRVTGEIDIHIYRSDESSDHEIRISTQVQKDAKFSIQFLQQFLSNHPNLFPLFQQLLQNPSATQ